MENSFERKYTIHSVCRCEYVVTVCMVRPLMMAVLLLSVHPWPTQHLLHLCLALLIDLPGCLPQAPDAGCCYQRGGELHAALLVAVVTDEPTWSCVSSLITGNPASASSPLGEKPVATFPPLSCARWGAAETCKLPHSLNSLCCCCWLWALFFDLEAGLA